MHGVIRRILLFLLHDDIRRIDQLAAAGLAIFFNYIAQFADDDLLDFPAVGKDILHFRNLLL